MLPSLAEGVSEDMRPSQPTKRSRRRGALALLALCAGLALLAAGIAGAAMIKVGPLVLHADGGFVPHELPRRSFAPIRFQGHADIDSTKGLPPALEQAVLYFDRDGRLSTAGLPECDPARLAGDSPAAARAACKGAIVGTGHVEAIVSLAGGTARVSSELSLFNGPRASGEPTVVFHAQAPPPIAETYVVVVPLERLHGGFSYRAPIEVPPIAGGAGTLVHADVKIGRRYRYQGTERSYTRARCSDGILEARGHFRFAGGVVMDGTVFKPCQALH